MPIQIPTSHGQDFLFHDGNFSLLTTTSMSDASDQDGRQPIGQYLVDVPNAVVDWLSQYIREAYGHK